MQHGLIARAYSSPLFLQKTLLAKMHFSEKHISVQHPTVQEGGPMLYSQGIVAGFEASPFSERQE